VPRLIIGVVAGFLALVWAGVQVDHLVTAYPDQVIFAASAVALIASAVVAARFHASHRRISLDPATRGTVITAAPAREAIARPAAPPPLLVPKAPVCDGPKCETKLGEAPWRCGGVFPDGHSGSGAFCSKKCMTAWQELMTTRHAAHR
jgi:hypothetical protein